MLLEHSFVVEQSLKIFRQQLSAYCALYYLQEGHEREWFE